MMTLFGQSYAWNSPEVLLVGGLLVLLVGLLLLTLRSAGRSARSAEPLLREMSWMSQRVQSLSEGQERLAGGLHHVSENQAVSQTAMLKVMEQRLAEVTRQMGESLQGTATRTARSLGELQQRLETIDKAQANIEKLSGNVLNLQDILANKQARGAFGEIQLNDIVQKALPADAYTMQATLSNGKRADCLIHLPNPPGPIVIDAKFPLEAYEALRRADTPRMVQEAQTSEAVYAELHANFPEVVREGFAARVWIVSPTTCMATLNTMRAVLKDARMREQAGAIRTALRQLHRDVEIVVERVDKLNTHFNQARQDLDGISTAAERAGKRAARLDNFDFEELKPTDPSPILGPQVAE